MQKAELDAPCKINIHLDIRERRPDGYHNMQSIFQLVSLCDTLAASKTEDDECRVLCKGARLPADNTVTRAFSIFRLQTGIKGGASFKLEKRVPSPAGLGGGSSDGAAAIRLLDALYGTRLSIEEMEAMALQIGSDCPFFIQGGAALVTGRGEKIFRIDGAKKRFGVLVVPKANSPTKEAFFLLDASRSSESGKGAASRPAELEDAAIASEYLRPPSEWRFFNSFTPILSAKFPSINRALIDLKDAGAAFCSMTGSGAAVFGVFEAESDADAALARLAPAWPNSYKFFFLAFSPDVK